MMIGTLYTLHKAEEQVIFVVRRSVFGVLDCDRKVLDVLEIFNNFNTILKILV